MPDGLRLDEGRQPLEARLVRPVLAGGDVDALDVVGRCSLQVGAVGGCDAGEVDRVDVAVTREPGRELGREAGQHVGDAAGQIRGREHLGERDGGQRPALRGHDDGGVAGAEHRREHADEAEQARLLRRQDGHHAGRLGQREVEVRPRDRVGGAGHLRELVGPAGVPDDAVDRIADAARAPRPPSRPRPRRPRRRTARDDRRASRPRGRSPGRGCRPSRPTSPGRPCAPPRRRRARPCARPGRRARAARRRRPRPGRSGPTPSAGTRRRSRACRSCARAGAPRSRPQRAR